MADVDPILSTGNPTVGRLPMRSDVATLNRAGALTTKSLQLICYA